jgi:hypothetical protein
MSFDLVSHYFSSESEDKVGAEVTFDVCKGKLRTVHYMSITTITKIATTIIINVVDGENANGVSGVEIIFHKEW